jgi:hypothetical protein
LEGYPLESLGDPDARKEIEKEKNVNDIEDKIDAKESRQ